MVLPGKYLREAMPLLHMRGGKNQGHTTYLNLTRLYNNFFKCVNCHSFLFMSLSIPRPDITTLGKIVK